MAGFERSRGGSCQNRTWKQQHQGILKATMKITYDAKADILRILFSNAAVEESDEGNPGIILDFDKLGNMGEWKSWTHPSGWKTRRQWHMRLRVRSCWSVLG